MKQDSNDLPLPHANQCTVTHTATGASIGQVPGRGENKKTGACSSYRVLTFTETNSSPAVAMDQRSLQEEFKDQFTDVVSRLQSKQLFQSDWDIASFAVFFIFIGMVLLLVVLVLIRCCCCCCCDEQPRRHKVGHENFGMET